MIVHIPPHKPSLEIVLYHYTQPQWVTPILQNRELKITRFGRSNDHLEGRMIRFVAEHPWKLPEDFEETFLRGISEEKQIGFCCFSISGTVNKLWNEYAKSDDGDPRGGICIQIVASKTNISRGIPGSLVEEVLYIPQVKEVVIPAHLCARIKNEKRSMDLADVVKPYIIQKLKTKCLKWQEEKEYRAFVADEDGSGMVNLGSDLMRVTGLILGEDCRLPPDEVNCLTQLYDKNQPLPAYRVRGKEILPA